MTELPKNHLDFWGDDPWVLYLVARSAMRNGHWKLVALPILEVIHKKAKSFETGMWLTALRDICCSSLSEFTVPSLEKSIENLNSARLSLSALCSSRDSVRYFMFPLRFVDCLCSMYAALRNFLVVINTNLLLNDKPAPFIIKKISIRLQACAVRMNECHDMWLDLYKHCFDADTNTTTFVELYGGMCALFSAALQLFAKQQPLSLVL
ncbi:unnamed protein product [Onchocerca flexuosa]|uniref:Mediator of RNA polymerase II transcription subunit 24 n=1 Tax=Onchocerca flexuosa TaxID=387005 RepID=A0A183HM89_9BILA|nr:unnamed protein product [Onchocerca flexuosa]